MTSFALAWSPPREAVTWTTRTNCHGNSVDFSKEAGPPVIRDKSIWSGMAVVVGTRVPVFLIDDFYAETGDVAEVVAAYPRLTEGAVFYALAYAREHEGEVAEDRARHQAAIADALR